MNEKENRITFLNIIAVVLAALIVAGCIVVFSSDSVRNFFVRVEYEKKYTEFVERYADEYSIDDNLIYAIIRAESDFDKDAVSDAGAIGLMQIMPDTYIYDIAPHILMPYDEDVLFDPESNIRAGTYYLSYLFKLFPSRIAAVASYNAGIGNVRSWLSDPELCDEDEELIPEKIPFPETSAYVIAVEENYKKYSELFPKPTEPDKPPVDDEKYSEPLYMSEEEVFALAKKYGEIYDIDPRLILAVSFIESSFNAHAHSRTDDRGLMQVTPSTYEGDIRPFLGTSTDVTVLYEPETNVKCGTYYLRWLFDRLGETKEVIVAYNYGIGNVLRMLDDENYSSDGKTLIYENIPNSSVQSYLRRVMAKYEEYLEKYKNIE